MRPIAYFTLGFAPVIALCIYFYFRNRPGSGFGRRLIHSYLLGAAGVILTVAALAVSELLGLNAMHSLKRILFFSFITFGGFSEFGKFIILRYMILHKKEIRKPVDTLTFSIMTSMGFTTLAMILFAANLFDLQSILPSTLTPFIYVFANMIFAVIMGFFVGMSKFIRGRFIYSLTGFLGAAFFHGIFTFCLLTQDFKLLSLFAFGSTVMVFFLGIKAANTEPEPSR